MRDASTIISTGLSHAAYPAELTTGSLNAVIGTEGMVAHKLDMRSGMVHAANSSHH